MSSCRSFRCRIPEGEEAAALQIPALILPNIAEAAVTWQNGLRRGRGFSSEVPSVRFLMRKGICPKGFEAFDEDEAKSDVKQQVSSFPRQEDGERPSLNHHPITHEPKLCCFSPFLEARWTQWDVPKIFTPRRKGETKLQEPNGAELPGRP